MNKHVRKVEKNISDEYRSLARNVMWILLTLFAILSYASEIRAFMLANFGTYLAGILDGAVITMITLTAAVYIKSLRRA